MLSQISCAISSFFCCHRSYCLHLLMDKVLNTYYYDYYLHLDLHILYYIAREMWKNWELSSRTLGAHVTIILIALLFWLHRFQITASRGRYVEFQQFETDKQNKINEQTFQLSSEKVRFCLKVIIWFRQQRVLHIYEWNYSSYMHSHRYVSIEWALWLAISRNYIL